MVLIANCDSAKVVEPGKQPLAEQERVTAGFVRRLQDFLSKARSNPKLRFTEKG